MTHSKYLQLAIRIDADIENKMSFLCYKLQHPITCANDKFLFLFEPEKLLYEGYSRWWNDNKKGNQQRIIALLFIHEMFLDELKKKKK